jgi:hypothetical protein
MIAHLIGHKPCPYASKEAKKVAKQLRDGGDEAANAEEADGDDEVLERPKKRKKIFNDVKISELTQSELKVFKGISIPFNDVQLEMVKNQFLRATISANLPFRWTEDPEIIKLFLLFRSAACDVIPSRDVLAGRLLNEESVKVEKSLLEALNGKYAVIA